MKSAKKSTPRDLPNVPELRAAADPTALIVTPALAVEIGLNESILLRQLAYLIKTSQHERDGVYWTYQSLNDLQKTFFPFWSRATIDRTIKRLGGGYRLGDRKIDGLGLVAIRDDLNRRKSDRTRWFALNVAAIDRLESVTVAWVDADPKKGDADGSGGLSHNETTAPNLSQNETTVSHNETTLPKTTTKIKESSKDSTVVKESLYDDDESAADSSSSAPAKTKRSNQKPLLKTPENGKADPLISALADVCDLSEDSEKVAEAALMIQALDLGGAREVRRYFTESWSREKPPNAKRPRPWAGQVVEGMKREAERLKNQLAFLEGVADCVDCGAGVYPEDSTCANCGRELAPFESV